MPLTEPDHPEIEASIPLAAITAGGWLKPTAPPIRVASQVNMPGLPPAPRQTSEEGKLVVVPSVDKK